MGGSVAGVAMARSPYVQDECGKEEDRRDLQIEGYRSVKDVVLFTPPLELSTPVVAGLDLVGEDLVEGIGFLDEDVAVLNRLVQQHRLQAYQLQHR